MRHNTQKIHNMIAEMNARHEEEIREFFKKYPEFKTQRIKGEGRTLKSVNEYRSRGANKRGGL